MSLPFTVEEFFGVFAAYNTAIWPAQVFGYGFAIAALALAFRQNRFGARAVPAILAGFWIWMGVAYHLVYFSPINPAAFVFGALFIVQGILFFVAGMQGKLRFEFTTRAAPIAGATLVLYAMVGYPLLGASLGHHYPAAPTFGVAPCPTTIFTFGLLLWSVQAVPRYLLVIPVLWAIVGTVAAVQLGVTQDYGLAIAAIATVSLLMLRDRRGQTARPTGERHEAVARH